MPVNYLATFYTHFGVLTFQSRLEDAGLSDFKLMAAPRRLSVSCGTAIRFSLPAEMDPRTLADEDTEKIYLYEPGASPEYREIYCDNQ